MAAMTAPADVWRSARDARLDRASEGFADGLLRSDAIILRIVLKLTKTKFLH